MFDRLLKHWMEQLLPHICRNVSLRSAEGWLESKLCKNGLSSENTIAQGNMEPLKTKSWEQLHSYLGLQAE